MKRKRVLLGMLLIGLLVPAPGSGALVDRIIAVVNDDIITLSELENAFRPYRARIDATYGGPDKEKVIADGRAMILNTMIDGRLIEQWSKKAGIVVKDDEITGTIRDLLRRRNMSMEEFTRLLERDGSSLDAYRQDMKQQMTRIRLLRRELKSKIIVGDDEIGEEYIKRRGEYEGTEAVRIKQILVPVPRNADGAARAGLEADAARIRQRLIQGEPFDLLAAQFSQGPAAAAGGDIGFVEKGTLLPEVDAVAFRLAKDEISEVIVSPVGLHIIQVLDRRGAGVKSIGMIREEIKARLEEEKMEKSYEEWIAELRKKSHIEIRL